MSSACAEEAPEIPVVTSMQQLRALKPIVLKGDMTARVGIDATWAPETSCLMVYALIDSYDGSIATDMSGLGPLHLICANGRGWTQSTSESIRWDRAIQPPQPALFIRSIPLEEAGNAKLSIFYEKKLISQVATTTTPRDEFHPWARLNREFRLNPGSNELRYSGAGLAYPIFTGEMWRITETLPTVFFERPLSEERTREFRKKMAGPLQALASDNFEEREAASRALHEIGAEALPLFKTASTDITDIEARKRLQDLIDRYSRQFALRVEDDDLIIDLPFEVQGSRPQDSFLFRWWINGRPYIPALTNENERRETGGSRVQSMRSVRMNVQMDYQEMKINAGDAVGVQALYCPCGLYEMRWKVSDSRRQLMLPGLYPKASTWLLGVSNRVEFKAK